LKNYIYKLALRIDKNQKKTLKTNVKNFLNEWDENEKDTVLQMMKYTFIGSSKKVKKELQTFLDETWVDEIMVASYIYDNNAKMHSYELVAEFFKKSIV
jgi:alkanesulfonate monooxygenase SsuD/methylene tetrahydromethanopterin reductase-like flavin-dependent oxidoreductase (luciferase family)